MADVKWIKLSTDIFEDEKVDYIQSLPEGDSIVLIWIRLLVMAGKCNSEGYIFLTEKLPYTEETLAYKFKKSVTLVKLALQIFHDLNMIQIDSKGIELVNWGKYQCMDGLEKIKEKEKEKIRKQKQRAKTKEMEQIDLPEDCPKDKLGTVPSTPSIIEEERELELDIDKELDIDRDIEKDKEENSWEYPSIYQEIVDNFNMICKALPRVTLLDENKKSLIKKGLIKFKDISCFLSTFKKVQASDFLSGRSEKWKGCSFQWVISEKNMLKILEGNYCNPKNNVKLDVFNDYEQRNYDFQELEKKLLGI